MILEVIRCGLLHLSPGRVDPHRGAGMEYEKWIVDELYDGTKVGILGVKVHPSICPVRTDSTYSIADGILCTL